MKKRKKSSIKSKRLGYPSLRSAIIRYFKRFPEKKLTTKQLLKKLKVKHSVEEVEAVMHKLVKQSVLYQFNDGRYRLARETSGRASYQEAEGKVDLIRSGAAYLIVEGQEKDIYIPAKRLRGAIDGDLVRVKVKTAGKPSGRGPRVQGEVIEIIKRAQDQFVGTVYPYKKKWMVVPDLPGLPFDVLITEEPEISIEEFDKVVVQVFDWNTGKLPHGRIVVKLPTDDPSDFAMQSILINKGFQLNFSSASLQALEQISDQITEDEIEKRRDCRSILTFTIDPATAKDFDDALSLRWLDNGEVEVGIHIADVTHYVKPDSALDREAYRRSTSVYLVDRVLPMLPERLSNDLCSLNPNEDKLTFSAIFTFDKDHKVTSEWFGKTVIHSDKRFTYEEAQESMEQRTGSYSNELTILNRIAHSLRKRNIKQGAIQFETDEVVFELDAEGKPIGLKVKERKDAHLLIEDFMLLANRSVARYIADRGQDHEIPYVYRIHDLPDVDRVQEFSLFARELGFEMQTQTPQQIARSFNALQKAAQKDPALKALAPLAIRSMAKAAYSTYNIGHYGLGFTHYSHFTSPIRRYADVLAHRILEQNLKGMQRVKKIALEDQCKYISAQERKAIEAERESVEYKQVEYIQGHIGEVFQGLVSGMIDRGFFVELLGSKCEGLVPFDSLNESFSLAGHGFKATGLRSGMEIKFGDQVKVRILDADLDRREIDMELINEGMKEMKE